MDNNLGELISKLRKEKGYTQKDLGDLLHVSDKAVSRWECGHSLPDVDKLLLISQIFEINLNDLITLRTSSSKDSDELVKEMIQEFSEANKKNAKKVRIILLFAIFVVLILTISIIFINSYNRFKVYRVALESDEFLTTSGIYVETRIRDTLNVGDIRLKNIEIKETDIVSVDLYIIENDKEIILHNYSSFDDIYFVDSLSYFEIEDLSKYFDKMYLKVTIVNSKNESKEFKTKLEFSLDFSNNKIFYKDDYIETINYKSETLDTDKIIKILLENDFEEISDSKLIKKTKKYTITYFKDSNKINYHFENNNLCYKYNYSITNNILEVQVFDENMTEISNYKYDTVNKKVLECKVGRCNDYKYAMEILNKNILNLLYES